MARPGHLLRPLAAIGCAVLLIGADAPDLTPGTRVNFVACPLVRDTYIPAWLAEHEGELFYLGPQGDLGTDFYPPQLGHRALVEGVVREGARISGGIPLEPVHVSVLPELDVSCNTILPALDYADPPHHRTPGPSNSMEEEEERPEPQVHELADGARAYEVRFAFDVSDRLFLRDTGAVRQAAEFARESNAGSVEVVGYRAGAVLSGGGELAERPDIAERRAAMVQRMLAHAGVPEGILESGTRDVREELDGVDDHVLRIARITVKP